MWNVGLGIWQQSEGRLGEPVGRVGMLLRESTVDLSEEWNNLQSRAKEVDFLSIVKKASVSAQSSNATPWHTLWWLTQSLVQGIGLNV
jgi:hypothetical protein